MGEEGVVEEHYTSRLARAIGASWCPCVPGTSTFLVGIPGPGRGVFRLCHGSQMWRWQEALVWAEAGTLCLVEWLLVKLCTQKTGIVPWSFVSTHWLQQAPHFYQHVHVNSECFHVDSKGGWTSVSENEGEPCGSGIAPGWQWLEAGRSLQESLLCVCPAVTLPSPAIRGHYWGEYAGLDDLCSDPLQMFIWWKSTAQETEIVLTPGQMWKLILNWCWLNDYLVLPEETWKN